MSLARKTVSTLMAVCFAFVFCAIALAQDAPVDNPTEKIDLWAVRQNYKTMIEIAEKGGDGYQQSLDLLIDQTLHLLRGPLPGGNAYSFATAKRNSMAEAMQLLSIKVDATVESAQYQAVTAEIAMPYELEIYCPTQRGFFKNNGDVFVKSYKIDLIIDGQKKSVEREFNDWVRRGTGQKIPLPGIAQWARIEVKAAVNPQDVNRTYLWINARTPEVTDDARNPYSFSIKQLKLARQYNELASKRKTVLEQLKEGYKGLDYVPVAGGGTASVEAPRGVDMDAVTQKIEYALYLLNGKDADKAEAKKVLGDLLKELKKK